MGSGPHTPCVHPFQSWYVPAAGFADPAGREKIQQRTRILGVHEQRDLLCPVHEHINKHVGKLSIHIHAQMLRHFCACMCVYLPACLPACMHACMYVCMLACMHVCIYLCMLVCNVCTACTACNQCMYACMHPCVYIHIYICIHMLVYVYVYKFSCFRSQHGCCVGSFALLGRPQAVHRLSQAVSCS